MTRKTITEDWGRYRKGEFFVSNNVWNQGDLVNGQDYSQSIHYNTNTLDRGVRFNWNWPASDHVLAYPEIVAGYKPWDRSGSGNLTAKVKDIDVFDIRFDYDISGKTSDFNVAFDLWLTSKPKAGAGSITTELMVWVHDGKLTPAGDLVGHYKHNGFHASIYVAENFGDASGNSSKGWSYIALESDSEIRKDTIDFAHLLHNLQKRGLIAGSDYVNGYEFGAEVTGNKGSLAIHRLHHDFEAGHAARTADDHGSNMAHHFAQPDDFLF